MLDSFSIKLQLCLLGKLGGKEQHIAVLVHE